MFKNLVLYRIHGWPESVAHIDEALQSHRFSPCAPTADKSIGWIEPRGQAHGPLIESVGGQHILKLVTETKSVPGSLVRAKADEEAARIEHTTGRKPGKRELHELREDALLALLPVAFPRQSGCTVWVDPARRLLAMDAASQGRADDVATALVQSIDGLLLQPLNTKTSPQTAMAAWLTAQTPDDWPADLSVERECVLKSADEDKAVVRYTRHSLAGDQIREHISQGKLPTQLALSWDGRVSFVLTEALQLRKIQFLEGVFESASSRDDDGFDADVSIATGELGRLLPGLIDALGGEVEPQAVPA
ncbi:MAG TPA: recombination-associated protein RdgC [Xanthomonadales bacterium]|nr:recombination-associated protein RdgC [Xanthomonadales bacterium]